MSSARDAATLASLVSRRGRSAGRSARAARATSSSATMSRLPGERAPVSALSSASLLAPAARECAAASARGDYRANARCVRVK